MKKLNEEEEEKMYFVHLQLINMNHAMPHTN
jgi:hypothetical protein